MQRGKKGDGAEKVGAGLQFTIERGLVADDTFVDQRNV